MKTRNPQSTRQNLTDMQDLFASSQLNHYEMFAVRGGEEKKSEPEEEGSTAPQQEDGFN